MVFHWKGFFWLVVDPPAEEGLRAFRSRDASTWTEQTRLLLSGKEGQRLDDGAAASHADVVVLEDEDRAFIFYFSESA